MPLHELAVRLGGAFHAYCRAAAWLERAHAESHKPPWLIVESCLQVSLNA
jgi:hypothetical protein